MSPRSKIPTNIHDTNLVRSMARRRGMVLKTISHFFRNSSSPLANTSTAHGGKMGKDHNNISEAVHPKPSDAEVEDALKPSIDLSKQPKGIVRWVKRFPGRVKKIYQTIHPPLTEEQIEELEAARREKALDKLCILEARKYAARASDKLAQLGMRELLNSPDPNKPKKLKKVRWSGFFRDALGNKILLVMDTNPKHLPVYVRVSELGRNPLYSDEMLPTLNKYSQWNSEDWGVGLTIYRHGLEGLPERVSTDELWKRCPDNKPPLTVAVGFGDNSSTHFINPATYPHLIISGGTGWGKSNMVHQIISFWLHRGIQPSDLQLVLFDLKKGMEFNSYENLPHLYRDDVIQTGIIEDLEGVLPAMRRMQEVRDTRMETIKHAGYKNFEDYNLGVPVEKRIPAVFLIFDEWAKIRLSRSGTGAKALVASVLRLAKEAEAIISQRRTLTGTHRRVDISDVLINFGKEVLKLRQSKHFGLEAEEMLAEFTNLARAAGMYVILSTQHPSKEVLSGIIMINFPTRIIFNSSVGGSMAALGSQGAFGLEYKGRAILMDRGQETKLQTPFISQETINAIVHKAITGKDIGRVTGIGIETILQHSLEKLDGNLGITKLYQIFRTKEMGGVGWDWLKAALHEAEGKEYILSGTTYRVIPAGYKVARRLIRIEK